MNQSDGFDASEDFSTFEHYHCARCAVTFHEAFPLYYDVTPCPACGRDAENIGLRGRSVLLL